jgi:hypothetical protein
MNGPADTCDALQAEVDALRARIESWVLLKDSFEQLAAHFGTGPQADEYRRRAASAADIIADLRRQERIAERQLEDCLEERRMRPPSITITGIEQTQATQFFRPSLTPCPDRPGQASCPENDIRLIAGKTAVLRAYIDVTIGTPSVTELSGVLETRQANSASWDVPLTPYNAPVVARRTTGIMRREANHTLNFRIPAERCQGTLETRLTVFDPGHPGEAGYTSPSVTRTLQFGRALPLMIRLIRIHYANAQRQLDVPAPSVDDFWKTAEYTLRSFPIPGIEVVAESEELYDGDFSSFFDTSAGAIGTTGSIFTIIDRIKAAEQQPTVVKYYALFDNAPNQTGFGGWAAGDRAAGAAGAGAGFIMAQEIGHTCGRFHAPCGVGNADANYPSYDGYPSASIGEYGFDVVDGTVYDPATTYDFMSYCGPLWVSPYTYEALMNCFPGPEGSGGGAPAERLRGLRELLRLFLRIYRDGRVRVRAPGFHAPGELRDASGVPTAFFVELQDGEGYPLEAKRLRLDDVHRSVDDASLDFLVEMPWRPETARIVVKREQETVHSIEVARQAPSIAMTWAGKDVGGRQRITWQADGGPEGRTYALRYSNDGGASFRILARELTETSYEVDFDTLPGGEHCLLQVLATAGIRTAIAVSGRFSVAPKPRRPVILAPVDGLVTARGATVRFFGVAHAPGGGSSSVEALNWASSIDGHLGSGSELMLHGLSPGRHSITLRVDDGCGGEGSASVYVIVKALSAD